jgi:hypothetical protein
MNITGAAVENQLKMGLILTHLIVDDYAQHLLFGLYGNRG